MVRRRTVNPKSLGVRWFNSNQGGYVKKKVRSEKCVMKDNSAIMFHMEIGRGTSVVIM